MTTSTNALVDISAENMWKEIEAGEKVRESALANYDTLLRNAMATEEWPEALTHQYVSSMIPRIVQENPTVDVSSRTGTSEIVQDQALEEMIVGAQLGLVDPVEALAAVDAMQKPGLDAMAGQHVLRRWIEQEDYRSLLNILCDDYLKAYGVEHSYMMPMEGDESRWWPCGKRLHPRRFIMDAMALTRDESAFDAHYEHVPQPVLERMAREDVDGQGGWDMKAIADLMPHANDRLEVDRKEVRVYHVWVRNYEGDGGYSSNERDMNGVMLTLGCRTEKDQHLGVEIRKPRPAYVPPWGPYTLYGCYNRSTLAWPMSPLLATFNQQAELQKHAMAMNTSARKYRRLVVCSKANTQLINALVSAPDHLVIPVDDEQFEGKKVVVVEVGGIQDIQHVMYGHMKQAFFRAVGLDDQQLGRVDSDATATAVAVADEAVATRASYIEGRFIAGVRNALRTKLWYMCMDERVSCRLGSQFGEQMNMRDPWFYGGLQKNEEFDFNDMELVIDPYSMGRVSEQTLQRRVMEFVSTLVSLAPVMMQFPFVDWKGVIRNIAQVLNLPSMDGLIDFNAMKQMATQIGQIQQNAMAMNPDEVVKQSQPQPNRQVGSQPAPRSNARQMVQGRTAA